MFGLTAALIATMIGLGISCSTGFKGADLLSFGLGISSLLVSGAFSIDTFPRSCSPSWNKRGHGP